MDGPLGDELFVPANQQTSVLYCRLSDLRREGICLEHVANTKPTEIISRKNLAPFVQKAGTLCTPLLT